MPIYTFRKPDGQILRHRMSISDYASIKSGEKILLDEDDSPLELVFDPGNVNFVLQDGESGGWMSKAHKENAYRKKHYAEMGRRQKEHAPRTRLVPNYEGKLADKWSDVQDHVHQEKGAAAAATYDHLVAKEGRGS
jgi:hypothetical protein